MYGGEGNRTPVLDRRGYNLEDSYIISLRISVFKCRFYSGEQLVIDFSRGKFDSLFQNFKANADKFFAKCFIVRKFSNCLVDDGSSKGEQE